MELSHSRLANYQRSCLRDAMAVLPGYAVDAISKSQLQVLSCSISKALGISYAAEQLDTFRLGCAALSPDDFVSFVETCLVPRVPGDTDLSSIDYVCWSVASAVMKPAPPSSELDATWFKAWRLFCVLDFEGRKVVDTQEAHHFIRELLSAAGYHAMESRILSIINPPASAEEGYLSAEFVQMIGSTITHAITLRAAEDGLRQLTDQYIHQVVWSGMLKKKSRNCLKLPKDYHITLYPYMLTYGCASSGVRSPAKRSFLLNTSAQAFAVTTDDSPHNFCFRVMCGVTKTCITFAAATHKTRSEWLNMIQCSIDGDNSPPPCFRRLLERATERALSRKSEEETNNRALASETALQALNERYTELERSVLTARRLAAESSRALQLERDAKLEMEAILLAEREARKHDALIRQEERMLYEEEKMEEGLRLKQLEDEYKVQLIERQAELEHVRHLKAMADLHLAELESVCKRKALTSVVTGDTVHTLIVPSHRGPGAFHHAGQQTPYKPKSSEPNQKHSARGWGTSTEQGAVEEPHVVTPSTARLHLPIQGGIMCRKRPADSPSQGE